jgi:transcriptional regulator with XRE-family HTH domain
VPPSAAGSDLRATRLAAHISLQTVADALGSWPIRISELERGLKHDTAFARRYMTWLAVHGEDAPKARRPLAV